MSPGEKALVEAVKHLGVKEDPPHSDMTPFGSWVGLNHAAWCCSFLSYCFKLGADYELCAGSKGPGIFPGKGCSYIPDLVKWLKYMNLYTESDFIPEPGD